MAKLKLVAGIALVALLCACSPEPGSEAWCEKVAEKPKGDWTANEAAEYAKSCLLK
jgi:hypothetical protein